MHYCTLDHAELSYSNEKLIIIMLFLNFSLIEQLHFLIFFFKPCSLFFLLFALVFVSTYSCYLLAVSFA